MSPPRHRQLRQRLLGRRGHGASAPCPRPVGEELRLRQALEEAEEALHPEGGGRGKTTAENAVVSKPATFTAELAAATGRSEEQAGQTPTLPEGSPPA